MGAFNYSRFHFFDKNGHELILNKTANASFTIQNTNPAGTSSEYALVSSAPNCETLSKRYNNISLFELNCGYRYKKDAITDSLNTELMIANAEDTYEGKIAAKIGNLSAYDINEYKSSNGSDCTLELTFNKRNAIFKKSFLEQINLPEKLENGEYVLTFPTYTFNSQMSFDKVSTELVETQSIYVLVENEYEIDDHGAPTYTTLAEYAKSSTLAKEYIDRFKLFFFIDCREQEDFRFFTIQNNEIVWSDRYVLDLAKDDTKNALGKASNNPDEYNGYYVNVGFKGENEGVYEQTLYIGLIDTSAKTEEYAGDVYIIGNVNLSAETEGEDERYRTLFKNFGIPDPKEYDDVFRDTSIKEDLPNYTSINKHSKQVFLSYSEIFPYVGSYKALFNAINLLGYDDIFFKEWYKDLGKTTNNGYVAFNIGSTNDSKNRSITNLSLEERVQLRKMNWLSLMYKINEETSNPIDKYGFPSVKNIQNYYSTGALVKLISLKKWLEKYILGVNCHIKDVGGEGIVFERYNVSKYGSYQQIFDYTNEKPVGISIDRNGETLIDGSANIHVNITTSNIYSTLEDYAKYSFADLCDGYFDSNSTYINSSSFKNDFKDAVYYGKTFEMSDNDNTFEIRVKGTTNSFRFGSNYISNDSPSLLIDDNKIIFDPFDLAKYHKNTMFTILPIIKIKSGVIKRYKDNKENLSELDYYAKISVDRVSKEYETFNVHTIDSSLNKNDYALNSEIVLVPPTYNISGKNILIYPPSNGAANGNSRMALKIGKVYNTDANINLYEDSYGLRYCIDNHCGIPCFKIIGYEASDIFAKYGNLVPNAKVSEGRQLKDVNDRNCEFLLEIYEGNMIFNDSENKRYVSLNFYYDEATKERKIDVTTLSNSQQKTNYEYKIDDADRVYTNRFTPESNYTNFVSLYKQNAENAVFYDDEKLVNVINAGTYNVNAILYDSNNNIFSAIASENIVVNSPYIDTSICVLNTSTSNVKTGYKKESIDLSENDVNTISAFTNDAYGETCLYEYKPKYHISYNNDIEKLSFDCKEHISSLIESTSSIKDSGINTIEYNGISSKALISNLTDRFICIDSSGSGTNKTFTLIKKSNYNGGVIVNDQESSYSCADKINLSHASAESLVNSVYTFVDKYGYVINTPFDVTVILYDESMEYPVATVPGYLTTDRSESGDSDEYKLRLYNDDATTAFENYYANNRISIYIIPSWSFMIEPIEAYNNDTQFNFIENANSSTLQKTKWFPFREDRLSKELMNYKFLFTNNLNSRYESKTFGEFTAKSYLEFDTTNHSIIAKNFKLFDDISSYESESLPTMFVMPSATQHSLFTEDVDSYNNGILKLKESGYRHYDYIDTQYSVELRDFDPKYPINRWSFDKDNYISYNKPINVISNRVILAPILGDTINQKNGFTDIVDDSIKFSSKWKIYKRDSSNSNSRTLLMECYNRIVPLEFNKNYDYGDYDVELTIYDKNGNKSTKEMLGAFSILNKETI